MRGVHQAFIVLIPQHGICFDGLRFVLEVTFIAKDMFVTIALSNRNISRSGH